jgi:hypothetical protein
MGLFNSTPSKSVSKYEDDVVATVAPVTSKVNSFSASEVLECDDMYTSCKFSDRKTAKVVKSVDVNVQDNTLFKAYLEKFYSTSGRKPSSTFVPYVKPTTTKEHQIYYKVCFVVDVTGSMSPYITGTKEQIKQFTELLKKKSEDAIKVDFKEILEQAELVFEVAIIAYRDFGDHRHFETLDFTSNIESVIVFLDHLGASGGNDIPEDVKGAFIHALYGISDLQGFENVSKRLSWDDNNEQVANRSLLWLADAPPHGKEFYKSEGDYHPEEHMEDWVTIFRKMESMNIVMYIMKLVEKNTVANDKMKAIIKDNNINLTINDVDISQSVDVKSGTFESRKGYEEVMECMSSHLEVQSCNYVAKNSSTGGLFSKIFKK